MKTFVLNKISKNEQSKEFSKNKILYWINRYNKNKNNPDFFKSKRITKELIKAICQTKDYSFRSFVQNNFRGRYSRDYTNRRFKHLFNHISTKQWKLTIHALYIQIFNTSNIRQTIIKQITKKKKEKRIKKEKIERQQAKALHRRKIREKNRFKNYRKNLKKYKTHFIDNCKKQAIQELKLIHNN